MSFIFVFGSNTGGHHGAGAAKIAYKQYGAKWGVGEGLSGQSYALPSVWFQTTHVGRGFNLIPMRVPELMPYVDTFLNFAKERSDLDFKVTQIGCGLAGGNVDEIAPLFMDAPSNCYFDSKWKQYLPKDTKFWGTF